MQPRAVALAASILALVAACSASEASAPSGPDPSTEPADASQEAAASMPEGGPPPAEAGPSTCPASICDGTTGTCAPLEACSEAKPCTSNAFFDAPTKPFVPPTCKSGDTRRPAFDDGAALTWTDAKNGEARAACIHTPVGASAASKRPLVVFIHGAYGTASSVYDTTSLRSKAATYPFADGHVGFVLASEHGRNLHWPARDGGSDGPHHDHYFRSAPSDNPDVRNVDRLVDALVLAGKVDPKRIYVVGWSNGAFFGQFYSMLRHETATPGGNRIAAFAGFDGGDPFQDPSGTSSPTCRAASYPKSTLPIYLVHRACDLVACDAATAAQQNQPPGFVVGEWLTTLKTSVGDPNVEHAIIDGKGNRVQACAPAAACTPAVGLLNHARWPDGIDDNGGVDWEPAMLEFLAAHPLP